MLAEYPPIADKSRYERHGTIENEADVDHVVEIIRSGGVVAVEFPGTGGLLYDASNAEAVEKAMGIKAGYYNKNKPVDPSERKEIQKTTSLAVALADIAPIVDLDKLDPRDRALFYKGENRKQRTYPSDEQHIKSGWENYLAEEIKMLRKFRFNLNFRKFKDSVSSLIFLKLPIHNDARVNGKELPPWTYSEKDGQRMVHVLNFEFEPQISKIMKKLERQGISLVGVTSMNYSGSPEVVKTEEEIKFADENELFFLANKAARNEGLIGSYTIVNPSENAIERHGNIAPNIVESIFHRHLIARGREAHYPPVQLPDFIVDSVFSKAPGSKKVEVLNRYTQLHNAGLDDMTIEEQLIREFIEK